MKIKSVMITFSFLVWVSVVQGAPLPDPTRPGNYLSRTIIQDEIPDGVTEWRVTAIRISETARKAVINNKLVQEGDQLGSATVLEIRPLSVVLNSEQRNIQVNLIKNEVGKTLSVRKPVGDE